VKKLTLAFTILCFFITSVLGTYPIYAQEFFLPAPGVRVNLSPEYNPAILKGIKVHPDNPFRFEFILDQGDNLKDSNVIPAKAGIQNQEQLKIEATRLIKYFLASLTIPEKDLWVNLSPYEKNRIIPQSFGLTEMGRDLLAEDYILKQITASLVYPEGEIGKKFWKRIYEEAAKKYGTTNIPVNTFNKVWIIPDKAVVYENAQAGTAYVVESKLKVMLEEDYLSLQKHNSISPTHSIASQVVREIVIPELTKEVNENKNFAQLRQVYNSLILATWYKNKIKESILEQVYADKNKIQGLVIPAKAGIQNKNNVEYIYQQYLKAFKKGVYNYIKEDKIPCSLGSSCGDQQIVARKYFSGGLIMRVKEELHNMSQLIRDYPSVARRLRNTLKLTINVMPQGDMAMNSLVKGSETEVVPSDSAMQTTERRVSITLKWLLWRYKEKVLEGKLDQYLAKQSPQILIKLLKHKNNIVRAKARRELRNLGIIDQMKMAIEERMKLVWREHGIDSDGEWVSTSPPARFDEEKIRKALRDEERIREASREGEVKLNILDGRMQRFLKFLRENPDPVLQDIVIFGGAVRDAILGRAPNDLDITVKVYLSEDEIHAAEGHGNVTEETYRQSEIILTRLAQALGVPKERLLPGAKNPYQFEGLTIHFAGPFKIYRKGRDILIKNQVVDKRTGTVAFRGTVPEILAMSLDCNGRLYGYEDALRYWLYGMAVLKAPGLGVNTLQHPALLKLLRLRHEFGLSISKSDLEIIYTVLAEERSQARETKINEEVKKIIATAIDPQLAKDELEALGYKVPDLAMSAQLPVLISRPKREVRKPREGGINLTPANLNLQTENSGGEIKFHMDTAMLAQLQNASGFVPVIINIQPMNNLEEFLGLKASIH